MEVNVILQGDVRQRLIGLPSKSIDSVVTSPPYWNLRNYGIADSIWDEDPNCEHEFVNETFLKEIRAGLGLAEFSKQFRGGGKKAGSIPKTNYTIGFCSKCHAWKGQLGLEPDYKLFVKHLCDIFDEVHRVLKNTGTLFVNLGDTMQKKGLLGIPYRFMIDMLDRGWILRNEIIWYKPNVLPSSAKDRFTVDFEPIFFFTKKKKYFFEQQFEPQRENTHAKGSKLKPPKEGIVGHKDWCKYTQQTYLPNGRNKRTVWEIPTTSFSAKDLGINDVDHFAVFPPDLAETCIKAGTPEFVCVKCGKPRMKEYNKLVSFHSGSAKAGNQPKGKYEGGEQTLSGEYDIRMGPRIERKFAGYSDCGCNAGFKPGIVMDIFGGSGTTAMVAKDMKRDYVLIEISEKYIKIAEKRIEVGRKPKVKPRRKKKMPELTLFNLAI